MGMPAARISDMHTCPMVHTGPAARATCGRSGNWAGRGKLRINSKTAGIGVGDMLTCVGVPDSIVEDRPR